MDVEICATKKSREISIRYDDVEGGVISGCVDRSPGPTTTVTFGDKLGSDAVVVSFLEKKRRGVIFAFAHLLFCGVFPIPIIQKFELLTSLFLEQQATHNQTVHCLMGWWHTSHLD